ncbi:hypothetical protein [Herbidospora yilanensis]|uniref:hypothetical protein n=1 Tax=Herbidospora yilanensis TaxID=354426 RepID=UPI000B337933|nr:hypothetical protein [Herbidospora yilanensis]
MTAQYGQNHGQQPHPYYGAPQSPYGAPPPQGPVRPRILWIVLSWVFFIVTLVVGAVIFAAGVGSTIANIGEIAPSSSFQGGETVKVNLNPADSPAIWAAAGQPTDVQCQVTGGDASQQITLEKATGSQTLSYNGTDWEMLFTIGVPAAGEYQVACDGDGVTFGVGKQLLSAAGGAMGGMLGGMAAFIGLAGLGFLTAVITTIVVLVRRSRARRRMMGMY